MDPCGNPVRDVWQNNRFADPTIVDLTKSVNDSPFVR
jgi:hypothetical protein